MSRPEYEFLGAEAKWPSGNYKGTIEAIIYNVTHTTQATIQPAGKGSDMPAAHDIDLHALTITKKVPAAKQVKVETTDINLGDEVTDQVTGFTGIATQMVACKNGCISFVVTGKHKGDKPADVIYLNHKRFKVKKAGAFKPVESQFGALRSVARKHSA